MKLVLMLLLACGAAWGQCGSAGRLILNPLTGLPDCTGLAGAGTGTVTSVDQSFTGGLISVSGNPVTTAGTLALTVAGTSGGIPYFSSASTWASSTALTNHGVLIGGGAGGSPKSTTAGTTGQVLTSNGASADPTFQDASAASGCTLPGCIMTGLPVVPMSVSQTGATGSQEIQYCVTATDTNSKTITNCTAANFTGPATLTSSNFYTITVAAWTVTAPDIAPVGACDVYRVVGGPSQGKIGTISSCLSGGSLNDTGLAGDSTSPPSDTSGVLRTSAASQVLAGNVLYTGNSSLSFTPATVSKYWTHNAIFGQGTYTNSGISAIGYAQNITAHACTGLGYGVTCSGDSSFVGGINSSSTGGNQVVIGGVGGSGARNIVIGDGTGTGGGDWILVGSNNSDGGFTQGFVIGKNNTATANFQGILGGPSITDVFAGGLIGNAQLHPLGVTFSGINDAAGTTNYLLAKLNSSNKLVTVGTSDTTVPAYPIQFGGGTSGSSHALTSGQGSCRFDASGATVLHWVVASTAIAGRCADAGASLPSSVWVIGQVQTATGANGTTTILVNGFYSGGGGGSGDVVGPSSATDNAIVRFDGTTGKLVQNSAVTIADTTGDISTPGGVSTGVGGSVAGYYAFGQGTATTAPTSSVGFQAPTSVTTKFMMTLPAAPATGFMLNTGTSDPSTISFVAGSGTGNVCLTTSCTMVTPTLGAASATSINGLTITSSTGTFTLTNGKTFAVTNGLTLAGTDSTTMTFPGTSQTIPGMNQTNTGGASFTLDMNASTSAASLRVPNIAGASSTTAGALSYDTTNKNPHMGANSVDNFVALVRVADTIANDDCAKFSVSSSILRVTSAGAACGSGGSGTAGATLFSTTNSTSVTATSATTLIGTVTGSTTIPANTFTAGQYLKFEAYGYYSTPATPVNLTIDVNIGGSVRITTGAVTQLASVTNGVWKVQCGVTTRTAGASGTQIANCIFEATGATLTPGEAPLQVSSTWTIDTTATNVFDIQATWSTATGSPTITSTNIAAWIPGAPVTSVFGTTGAVANLSGDATTSGSSVVTVAKINGVAVTGTPSVGYVPTATSSSAATWQAAASGVVCDPFDTTTFCLLEEFPINTTTSVQIGTHGWTTANTGASVTIVTSQANHPGLYEMRTSTSANNRAAMMLGNNSTGADTFPRLDNVASTHQWVVRVGTGSSSMAARVCLTEQATSGSINATTGCQRNGILIEYDPAISNNWFYYFAGTSSVSTGVDSGVAANTTTNWYTIKAVTSTGGTVTFSISTNGGAFSTAKTICPSGCDATATMTTLTLSPAFYLLTTDTNDKRMTIDRYQAVVTGLSR